MRKITYLVILSVLVAAVLLTGCRPNEPQARRTLEQYLARIQAGNHTEAYKLVSDYDKQTITEADFIEWRASADAVVSKQAFRIGRATDRLKNYEYMGTRFRDAYGFDVTWEQEYLVPGAATRDYDQDSFKILVVEENGDYRVALILSDLAATTEYYKQLR